MREEQVVRSFPFILSPLMPLTPHISVPQMSASNARAVPAAQQLIAPFQRILR